MKVNARAEPLLVKMGLGKYKTIHCSALGFDPSNRDGTGGNALGIEELAEDSVFVGYDPNHVAHASCI